MSCFTPFVTHWDYMETKNSSLVEINESTLILTLDWKVGITFYLIYNEKFG